MVVRNPLVIIVNDNTLEYIQGFDFRFELAKTTYGNIWFKATPIAYAYSTASHYHFIVSKYGIFLHFKVNSANYAMESEHHRIFDPEVTNVYLTSGHIYYLTGKNGNMVIRKALPTLDSKESPENGYVHYYPQTASTTVKTEILVN